MHCVQLLELDVEFFQKFLLIAGLLWVEQVLLRIADLDRLTTLCEQGSSDPVCVHSNPLDHLLELLQHFTPLQAKLVRFRMDWLSTYS